MTELGLTVPVRVVRVLDGDTIEVELRRAVTVRLEDCWAKEMREPGGKEAKENLQKLADTQTAILHVPWKSKTSDIFTFGRVVGRLYVEGKDISELQVIQGFATREKSVIPKGTKE